MNSCIMHLDIDAFFASVEQVRNPHLRGRPVIVGSGVIASCSYEGRARGLYAGMTLTEARRLCPEAVILEGHYPTYRCFSDRVFELCREVCPRVETYLDEAYADLTGTQAVYGDARNVAVRLKRQIAAETGLTVSVGIGTTKTIAKIAGGLHKPDGLVIIHEADQEQFLAGLRVEELPGIGPARRDLLHKLNIYRVDELLALNTEYLEALFGENGRMIYQRCRGQDIGMVRDKKVPQSIRRETAFHADTGEPTQIEGMLYYLIERAARALRDASLRCRSVQVHFRYSDGKSVQATEKLPAPTELDIDIFDTARAILWRLYTRRVRLHSIGVQLSRLTPAADRQPELFGPTRSEKLAGLYQGMDRLRRRFGHSAILAGACLEGVGKLRKDRYGYILRTPCLTK